MHEIGTEGTELEELPGEIKTEGRKQLESLGTDRWDVKTGIGK